MNQQASIEVDIRYPSIPNPPYTVTVTDTRKGLEARVKGAAGESMLAVKERAYTKLMRMRVAD